MGNKKTLVVNTLLYTVTTDYPSDYAEQSSESESDWLDIEVKQDVIIDGFVVLLAEDHKASTSEGASLCDDISREDGSPVDNISPASVVPSQNEETLGAPSSEDDDPSGVASSDEGDTSGEASSDEEDEIPAKVVVVVDIEPEGDTNGPEAERDDHTEAECQMRGFNEAQGGDNPNETEQEEADSSEGEPAAGNPGIEPSEDNSNDDDSDQLESEPHPENDDKHHEEIDSDGDKTPEPRRKPLPTEPQEQDLPNIEKYEGVVSYIKQQTQVRYVVVVNEICRLGPSNVADHLFKHGKITHDQMTEVRKPSLPEKDKARQLADVLLNFTISPRFAVNLEAFADAGVTIVQSIAENAQRLFPEAFQEDCESSLYRENERKLLINVKEALTETKRLLKQGLSEAEKYIRQHADSEVGNMLLHEACRETTDLGTFHCVLLIYRDDKSRINFTNRALDQRTPLHVACACAPKVLDKRRSNEHHLQQLTKVSNLLAYGANCTLKDADGNTPLHLATIRDSEEIIRLILEHNQRSDHPSCINIGNNLGNTALHIACREGYLAVVKSLLWEHKADPRLPNTTKKRRNAFLEAVVNRKVAVTDELLKADSTLVDSTDAGWNRGIHISTRKRSILVTKSILKQKHSPLCVYDKKGKSPLHYACHYGSRELVALLLSKNNSAEFVNCRDNNGDTALHITCRHGDEEVRILLLANHADKDIKNELGETPQDVACGSSRRSSRLSVNVFDSSLESGLDETVD